MCGKHVFSTTDYDTSRARGADYVRPVLSRYLGADFGADFESDLRTKTDQIGSKSVCFAVLDRTIPLFLPIGEPLSKIGILAIG
jgi:hypothetical protein